MITQKQKKRNEALRVLGAVMIGCLIVLTLVNLWVYLMYNGQAINRKNFSNWTAKKLCWYIESNAEILGMPEKGEAFLSGGADRYANFAAAAYLSDEKTVYLYGNETTGLTAYWTARIQDGKPQEIWYSMHRLTADELRPYTDREQLDSMHFVIFPLPHSWIDDTKLVGYWMRRDTDET